MSGDKRRILLVDDEPACLEPLSLILAREYCLLTATCGQRALDLLETETVDIVIADNRMPGISGVELLVRVRKLYPDVVRVVLTGHTDLKDMLKAINEGHVYRYVSKPWNTSEMLVTVRQALEWKDLRASRGHLAAELQQAHRELAESYRKLAEQHRTLEESYALIEDRIDEFLAKRRVQQSAGASLYSRVTSGDGRDRSNGGIGAPEFDRIIDALERTNWIQKDAATLLEISTTTLWRRMKKYGIQRSTASS